MSFLSTAFLLALPFVAVPVAIHLYRGRQRDVVLWGAMQFLAAAATKGRRMERLEELVLLSLRLAAVAALVLALARPMIRGNWLGRDADREVILVVDNSLSMSREVDGQSAADRLKVEASELIDSLAASDSVQVLFAAGSEWVTAEPIVADGAGKRRLRDLVAGAEPTLGAADLLECLQAAVHVQPADETSSRRVVVLTDGQANSWQLKAAGAWRRLAADRDAAKVPITIHVVTCGHSMANVDNLAVTDIRSSRNLIRPGEPVELAAEISNVGDIAGRPTRVLWLVGEKVVQESSVVALQRRAKTQVTANLRLTDPGFFTISCRIEEVDEVPLDQENSLVMEVADQIPILFVEGDSGAGPSVGAPTLIAAALGFKGNEPQPWHSVYRPEVISPATLATHSLADYRAILINNLTALDRSTIERLDAFVRTGGGLWVALGDKSDRVGFNRDWYSDGDGLSPLAVDSLEVVEKAEDVAATVHPPSSDHPATVQLADTTQLDIDEARVRQRWLFAAHPAPEQGRAVSALLESGNGHPLVVENYVGQGRVLVQAFPLGLEWSNLPLLKAYVVMIHDLLNYVTTPTMARHNLSRGASIIAVAPPNVADAAATLVTPRGREIPLVATDADVAPVFRYSQTRLPGMYHVRFVSGGELVDDVPFYVVHDANESYLQPVTDLDRARLLSPAGIQLAGSESAVRQTAGSTPKRDPLWGVLLTALVVLLAGELMMSSWLARKRHGLAVGTV